MTSPVDTSVKWARYDMPGAPVLKTEAGSLIALLDAFLVNGWGLQTATSVVVAGGVATATFPTDHAAIAHSVVLVDGATPAALNGEQRITAIAPNKVSWATAAADGTATGTITVKMAAAGWNKPFTGTNLAVYRSASVQGHGQYLRVNDANVLYARVLGYETMSAVSTGTNSFPTNAQISGGRYWAKGYSQHSNPVPWLIASDGRMVHLFMFAAFVGDPGAAYSEVYSFGDLVSPNAAGDPFATLIGVSSTSLTYTDTTSSGGGPTSPGLYVTRPVMRTVGARNVGIDYETSALLPRFPDPSFGGALVSSVYVREGDDSSSPLTFRGRMPGVYACRASGVQAVLGMWPTLKVDGGHFVFSGISSYSVTRPDAPAVALDISGPWR